MVFNKYSLVLVSGIPDSYAAAALGLSGEVDLDKARRQHKEYVKALEELGCDVVVVAPDETLPDCVFVEDTAVILDGRALMTRPGHANRVNEVNNVRPVLKKQDVVIMEMVDPDATLDGGDVIFTGKEILVGLSKRTNEAGVREVQRAFPQYSVTSIPVSGPLHLTTMVSMCGPNTICASTETGNSIRCLKEIQSRSRHQYETLIVPHDTAANTVYINGGLIHKSTRENKESAEILKMFCKKKSLKSIEIDLSEIEKAVGSITCMSLRFTPGKQLARSKEEECVREKGECVREREFAPNYNLKKFSQTIPAI